MPLVRELFDGSFVAEAPRYVAEVHSCTGFLGWELR